MKKSSTTKFVFPIVIIVLVAVLSFRNYAPGTILSGWDTLHPEFNFGLYLKRTFNGAWMEHQGVGAPAAQAQAAELARLPIVYLLDLILPTSLVRYFFYFLTLLVGTLGVYFFVKEKSRSSAFLGALFYLLNLTTLQHYYVPLEMFAVHFALVPWLFALAQWYLSQGKKKILIWFFVVTLLSAPMAHTATLFYVYFGALVLFIGTLTLLNRFKSLKRGFLLISATLLINSFWLLPNVYFVVNHSLDVTNSAIHRIFSDEAFLQSRSFGNLSDLALEKNFLFNWRDFDFEQKQFVDIFDEWRGHLDQTLVKVIGYTLFTFSIAGVVLALVKKSKAHLTYLPVFLVASFFLINANPPFEALFLFLREKISLFKEGLRFPFTKFSLLFSFGLAIYLSYFVSLLKNKTVRYAVVILLGVGIVYFNLPAFKGNLISDKMKVEIPTEYFEVFDWFEANPQGRIAKFPLQTRFGWNYYSWGYQGAGFTWFGLVQPTLDREFDRWSPYNESFYNEATFTLYQKDLESLEKVLAKYQVRYLLLDESVSDPNVKPELFYFEEIKNLFDQSEHITKIQEFGLLTIYETDFNLGQNFVWAPQDFVEVKADLTYAELDPIYQKYGDYIVSDQGAEFPFVNFDIRKMPVLDYDWELAPLELVNGENRPEIVEDLLVQKARLCSDPETKLDLTLEDNGFVLESLGQQVCLTTTFTLEKDSILEVKLDHESPDNLSPLWCITKVGEAGCLNSELDSFVDLASGDYWLDFVAQAAGKISYKNLAIRAYDYPEGGIKPRPLREDFSLKRGHASAFNCDLLKSGNVTKKNSEDNVTYGATEGGVSCDFFAYPTLRLDQAYLMRIKGENREGRSLKFYLVNDLIGRTDIEELLPNGKFDEVYMILPKKLVGSGYTLNIETRSFGRIASENTIEAIEFRPVDYETLTQLAIGKEPDLTKNNLKVVDSTKTGTWFYKVKVEGGGVLGLSQGFEDGWLAYQTSAVSCQLSAVGCKLRMLFPWFFADKLKHVKVNNWANAWLVQPSAFSHQPSALSNQSSAVGRQPKVADSSSSLSGLRAEGRQLSADSNTIIIVYWPQLLDYLGFAIAIAAFLFLLFDKSGRIVDRRVSKI